MVSIKCFIIYPYRFFKDQHMNFKFFTAWGIPDQYSCHNLVGRFILSLLAFYFLISCICVLNLFILIIFIYNNKFTYQVITRVLIRDTSSCKKFKIHMLIFKKSIMKHFRLTTHKILYASGMKTYWNCGNLMFGGPLFWAITVAPNGKLPQFT